MPLTSSERTSTSLDTLLLLRVRGAISEQSPDLMTLGVEVLIDYRSIYPAAPCSLDLKKLAGLWFEPNNAYGRYLGQAIADCAAVDAALRVIAPRTRVRVQLMLEEPSGALAQIRWERLELPSVTGEPLALSPDTPFSRFAAMNRRLELAPEDRVFRLALVVSSPEPAEGFTPIDPGEESLTVIEACSDLLARGQMTITLLPGHKGLTEEAFRRIPPKGVTVLKGSSSSGQVASLLEKDFHGLHLIAHGTYVARSGFYLLLEQEDGTLAASHADGILQTWNLNQLRLIFLESCQSASSGDSAVDLRPQIHSLMRLLIDAGVPGVVAMQDAIEIPDARLFNQGFYNRLLLDGLADEATNYGRRALRDRANGAWSIPALMTRLQRGAVWRESSLRGAQRRLYAYLQAIHQDIFSDFPVDVIAVPGEQLRSRATDAQKDEVERVAIDESTPIDVHLALDEALKCGPDTVCLLGSQGTAKTTILESAFLGQASRHWEEHEAFAPVLLRLSDCAHDFFDVETTVAEAIAQFFAQPQVSRQTSGSVADREYPAATLDAAALIGSFTQQRYLFMINADDQVGEGVQQKGLETLKRFRESLARKCPPDFHRYLLTLDESSMKVADLPENAQCLLIQPMTVERVRRYLGKYSGNGDAVAAQHLKSALADNGLFDLAAVPWLLGEMLDQARRGVLELNRAAILRRITNERIARFTGASGMRARVEEVLYRLAFEMQLSRKANISGLTVFEILLQMRGNRDYSLFEFRTQLIDTCHILASFGDDGVHFAYPGFRAYCCAQYILRQPDEERDRLLTEITATLGRRSRVEWWRETLYCIAGLWRDEQCKLLRLILSGSPLHEGDQLYVAARCLQEMRQADSKFKCSDPIITSIVSALIYRSHPMSEGSALARTRALEFLGPLKEPSAIPHLVGLVLKKIRKSEQHEYSGVRLAAIKALLYTQKEALECVIGDPEWKDNTQLRETVGHWASLNQTELVADLKKPDSLSATVAAFAISLLKPEGALDLLQQRLLAADADSDLLWSITDSIRELGDPNIGELINVCIEREDRRIFAAYLIGKYGAAHLQPAQRTFLMDCVWPGPGRAADPLLQGRCLQALAELHDDGPRVLQQAYEWLAGADGVLRYYALQAIRFVGDRSSLSKLEEMCFETSQMAGVRVFERLRLEVYEDLYWRLAGGMSREVMVSMDN